jgi:hypothetical protein
MIIKPSFRPWIGKGGGSIAGDRDSPAQRQNAQLKPRRRNLHVRVSKFISEANSLLCAFSDKIRTSEGIKAILQTILFFKVHTH